MNLLKGFKLKTPKVANLSPTGAITPVTVEVNAVKPVESQMSKFNGIKRRLAHSRNLFKQSKD